MRLVMCRVAGIQVPGLAAALTISMRVMSHAS